MQTMLRMISKLQEVQGNSNSEVIESAEKSADKTIRSEADLSDRHKQILSLMDTNVEYSVEEKGPLPDKEADQMAWVRAANQYRAIAEEIILRELIYV